MMDFENGIIRLSEEIIISPNYTFEQFKNTSSYCGQNEKRYFFLNEHYKLNEHKYGVGLAFNNGKIRMVTLECYDKEFREDNIKDHKKLYDAILQEYGICEHKEFAWGGIESSRDPKSGFSSIVIAYRE